MRRRKILKGTRIGIAASIAGCVGGFGGNDIQDSDGDGVIDSEDYAPNDPEVQEKSDIRTATPTPTPSPTPTPDPSADFTFLDRSPLDGYIVMVDVEMKGSPRMRIVYKNEVIGEFVGGDSYSETIMGGTSDAPAAEEMARIAAVAKIDGEWKTVEETHVIG